MGDAVIRAIVALALVLLAAPARAETITVGVFAPAVPFEGTAARVAFATSVARHLGAAVGAEGVGRVYARAGDFAAAVRKGELQVAIVDAAFLASRGGDAAVLAVCVIGGDAAPPWQLVARDARRIADLRGRALLVPTIGGRESDLVLHALFGGELPRGFFSSIAAAPDARSATAAVAFGKADAAVVPVGVPLPAGVRAISALPRLSAPVVVAFPALGARRARVVAALPTYTGDPIVDGFRAADRDAVTALAAHLAPPRRRGPMLVPPLRLPLDALVDAARRALRIERADPVRLARPARGD